MTIFFKHAAIVIVCCPEDIVCSATRSHDAQMWCDTFSASECNDCRRALQRREPEMPAAALSNDMMGYHAPENCCSRESFIRCDGSRE